MHKQPWKTILIDFDGTIVDSIPNLYSLYLFFLQKFGIEGNEAEFNALDGCTMEMAIRLIVERYRLPITEDLAARQFQSLFYEKYVQNCAIFPGVREFLAYAKNSGVQLAVVTAANRKLVQAIFEKENIGKFFADVVTAEGLPFGKPHPGIYLRALDVMSAKADETIAIEDGAHGIQSAMGANITVWRFAGSSWDQTRISQKISDEDGQDLASDLLPIGREHCPRDKARSIGGKDELTDRSDSSRGCKKSGLKDDSTLLQNVDTFQTWLEIQNHFSQSLRACGSL